MNITPKTFRATADFTVGTESYAIGDSKNSSIQTRYC